MARADVISIPGLSGARIHLGISQWVVAEKADVSFSTVCRAEKGGSVKFSTAGKLARAVGKKIEDLI